MIAIAQEGDDFLEKSANLPIIKYRKVLDGTATAPATATAYVCVNQVCRLATTNAAQLEQQITQPNEQLH